MKNLDYVRELELENLFTHNDTSTFYIDICHMCNKPPKYVGKKYYLQCSECKHFLNSRIPVPNKLLPEIIKYIKELK